jgi:hypothetical protein
MRFATLLLGLLLGLPCCVPFLAPAPAVPIRTLSRLRAGPEPAPAAGLPWWWDAVWKLPALKPGPPSSTAGTPVTFADSANVFKTNIEQLYGGFPSLDGAPMAEGALDDLAEGTMFVGLQRYFTENGSP